MARPIVEAFLKLHPEARAHLKHVHVTRWGHAIIINRPGLVTRWLPRVQKQVGPIYLASSDGQALPAMETSTMEAMDASEAPVIFSHSCAKAVHGHGRNIVDEQIKAYAAGQPIEKIEKDTERDRWMDAQDALNYGIIDEVLSDTREKKKKPSK